MDLFTALTQGFAARLSINTCPSRLLKGVSVLVDNLRGRFRAEVQHQVAEDRRWRAFSRSSR
jgi:hypothetical protein